MDKKDKNTEDIDDIISEIDENMEGTETTANKIIKTAVKYIKDLQKQKTFTTAEGIEKLKFIDKYSWPNTWQDQQARTHYFQKLTKIGIVDFFKQIWEEYFPHLNLEGKVDESTQDDEEAAYQAVCSITGAMWNGTSQCHELREAVLLLNVDKLLVDALDSPNMKNENGLSPRSSSLMLAITAIINNCLVFGNEDKSRRHRLREHGAVNKLKPYLDKSEELFQFNVLNTLSKLMDEDESSEVVEKVDCIKLLITLLKDTYSGKGFTVWKSYDPTDEARTMSIGLGSVMHVINLLATTENNKVFININCMFFCLFFVVVLLLLLLFLFLFWFFVFCFCFAFLFLLL